MSNAETRLHLAVAEFLDWTLKPPAMYTTFPAGWGMLKPAAASILKRCGLKSGIPDILVFHNGATFGIELKTPEGKPSTEQREMFGKLRNAGVNTYVCRSIDDVARTLKGHQVPMKPCGGWGWDVGQPKHSVMRPAEICARLDLRDAEIGGGDERAKAE